MSDEETLMITGGKGGHVAMTEDLDVACAAIEYAAGLVGEATALSRRSRQHLEALDVPLDLVHPDLGWQRQRAAHSISAITGGPVGTVRIEEALQSIGERLRLTVAAMEEAENASYRTMSLATRAKEAAADFVGLAVWGARGVGWVAWKGTPLGAWGLATGVDPIGDAIAPGMPQTTGLINRDSLEAAGALAPPGTSQRIALGLAIYTSALERLYGEARLIGMRVRPEQPAPLQAPEGLPDLVRGVESVANLADGSITVQKLTGPQGDAYIVYIPGTQDWGVWSANPFDLNANGAGVGGLPSDAKEAIEEAMLEAGISGDAPVMLVGHSQSGINTMAVVANSALASKFNFTHVFTFGAAGPAEPFPDKIQGLHLEHPEDVVPGMDLGPLANGANQTTVTHAISQSSNPDMAKLGQVFNTAHTFDGYAFTADLTESSESTSVQAYLNSADAFLGSDVVAVESTTFSPVTQSRLTEAATQIGESHGLSSNT